MACFAPLTAFYAKEVGATGKRGITFNRDLSHSGVKLRLPCGQCIGCRLEHSRQWAIRCMHEKLMHEENCFLTLTYDDKSVPEGYTLVKRDFTLFMKRLRKRLAKGKRRIRFYACGEYGETTLRPHYHAILFGVDFADKQLWRETRRGDKLYTSPMIDEVWGKGMNVLGDVTFESAAYVARYVVKKVRGPDAWQHYQWVDSAGVIYDRVPEYTNMSRMPGIGMEWFKKFGAHAYAHDSVVINGKLVRPPRFYDTQFEVVDLPALSLLKVKRRRKAMKRRGDNTPDRRRVREQVEHARLAQSTRDV